MIPSKLDLLIWRGTSFELELVSQIKNYIFDPDVHNAPADLRRTHAENLAHYGYTYDYVDFNTVYTAAELIVLPPWRQNASENRTPLITWTTTGNHILLGTRSVQIGIGPSDTQAIDFDSGNYKLILITASGQIDGMTYGELTIKGEK
jgi:hypothetical protein